MTSTFGGGAIDLGEVKARAEAQAAAEASEARRAAGGSSIDPVVEATEANIQAEVLERSQQVPVVVQVGSARSPQSEQLRQDLSMLAQQANGSWIYAHIDAEAYPQLAQMLGVQAVPTVVAIAGARPLADFQGGQPLEALQQWTAAVVNACAGMLSGLGDQDAEPAEDPRFEPALDALNAGDFDAAIAVYEDILAKEPNNTEAKAARDNARLLSRLKAHEGVDAASAIADSNASPSDVEKAFVAADFEIAAGVQQQAFDRLISALSLTAGEDKTRVKERLLELFALFEPSDPVVLTARQKMASALF